MSQTIASKEKLAIEGGSPVRTAPWPPRKLFDVEEKAAAMKVLDESITTGNAFGYEGIHEKNYCDAFVKYMGGGYADAVNSGSSAVYVALRMLDLPPYSEVIIPPCSDPGGVMPVPLLGCIPVSSDAAPRSYNMGAEQIAARITPRTSAILVAHIAGQAADMDPILALAKKHRLPVVEDCAQCHGATYKGKLLGTLGDVAAFSTMFGKHHATGGQGGVVYTRREDLYWHGKRIADRGKAFNIPNSSNVIAGLNLNQNELACAIGVAQLEKLPRIVAGRRNYMKMVAELTQDLVAVRPIYSSPGTESSYWFAFVELDLEKLSCDKNTYVNALAAEGLPAMANYANNPCESPWYKERRILGQPGWPWTSAEYKGDPNASYSTPNFNKTIERWFRLFIHENCGQQEAIDFANALRKVEAHYLKV